MSLQGNRQDHSHRRIQSLAPHARTTKVNDPKETEGMVGSLFLPSDEEYNFDNLTKITIEGNTIFQRTEEISVNTEILEKIKLVRSKVKSSHKDFDYLKPIEVAIGSIERSYINTAIISKDDLKWLNKIYNSFKES